jgi:NitT/TauT family transport system substrate-binding protein
MISKHLYPNRTGFHSKILLLALLLLLSACGGQDEPVTLKLAMLPIMDTLPAHVAQEQGYFADENLVVEFLPVGSAPDRDQLIKSRQADGMVNELLSTMFYNSDSPEVITVRYARKATPEFPHFYILAASGSGINTVEDVVGREIGISEGTIIEYSTDRLLQEAGLSAGDYNTIAVPRIPDRLALLGSGELAAANMPDPAAALAIQSGATIVIDDSKYPQYGHSVYTFRKELIDENPAAVRGFLNAIERAVNDINNDKEQWSDLLSEKSLVPPPLLGSYTVPDFPTAGVPTEEQWADMLQWAQEKGYLSGDLDYAASVNDSYLP